jgi:hypothetical protein
MHLIPLLTKVGLVADVAPKTKSYREDHDQQDSHASEREGAGPLKGNILRALSPRRMRGLPAVIEAYSSRTASRLRRCSARSNALRTAAMAALSSAAWTVPRYSPRWRKIDTRQERSFAAVGFFFEGRMAVRTKKKPRPRPRLKVVDERVHHPKLGAGRL